MSTDLQPLVDTTADDVGFSAKMTPNLRGVIHNAGVQAVVEVFTNDVLPAAQAMSPVGTPPDDKHPGLNRDSLAVSFRDSEEEGWISAHLYTQSGYGWLLEHGTSHNRALTRLAKRQRHGAVPVQDRTPPRPYLMPAVLAFCQKIIERQAALLAAEE